MISFFNYFVKITGWLPQKIVFRTKIYYEDKTVQSRRIKGKAIIVSNHTSVYDYAAYLFVFFFTTLRCQMAEILYRNKLLALFLKMMGGIYVNRDVHDLSCIYKSNDILAKNGKVLIFPEGRIPKKDETSPLEYKPGAAILALMSEAPIIPVYTDGGYFSKKRARVIIGKPIKIENLIDKNLSEKENIDIVNNAIKEKIVELGRMLDEKK